MIISETPHRISFFGGGTDYPVWYREHSGAVLATSIDKYCFITCRYLPRFFEHRYRIVYSRIELVTALADIQHPSVRECLRFMGIGRGVEIHHNGDIPARTGMASSSAFTVGLLRALHALLGEAPDPLELAREAITVEQDLIGESVGSQDQTIVACGGFQRIDFHQNGGVRLTPLTLRPARLEELQRHLLLVYTGVSRNASEIAGEQIKQTPRNGHELHRLYEMVGEAISLLSSSADIAQFGRLLDEAWQLKRGLSSKISTDYIDQLYAGARSRGAIGGKLLGAGGGGFFLLFARPEDHARILGGLNGLVHVPFRFTDSGSRIIYHGEMREDGLPPEELLRPPRGRWDLVTEAAG